jgi:hypothetical protein
MVFVNIDVEFEEVLSQELFDHVFLVQEGVLTETRV